MRLTTEVRQWNRQFVNIDDLAHKRNQVRQWFVNSCWRPQNCVNDPESSSMAKKFVNIDEHVLHIDELLTNQFVNIDELSGLLTNFCCRHHLLTNHWRTIDEPLTNLAALTNQIVNIDELPVSLTKLLWSPACFEEPWANLGALMISSSMRPQWQTLLSHDDLAWSIASWNELSFNCHGWSFVDFFFTLDTADICKLVCLSIFYCCTQ